MRKNMIFGGIAAALALAPLGAVTAAAAYEAPSGIELSIADVKLERSELHGDTLVEVPVNISNNSGFVSLKTIICLDSRLHYDEPRKLGTDTKGISGINIMDCDDIANAVSASFEAVNKSRFTEDGIIGAVRVIVPEDIPDGRYDISFLVRTEEFETGIFTYNSFDARFGSDCFSKLEGGSIIIGEADEERPQEQAQPEQPQRNSETERNDEAGESSPTEIAAAVTSAVSTSASAASSTTSAKATTSTRAVTTASAVKETTAESTSENKITTVSATTAETDADTDNTDTKRKSFFVPVIIAAVIALGTTGFIVRKRR